jgi:BMFP domain-containing protein YqiC
MAERSRIFDDVAGVAGGAFSALAGIGEELGALVRARVDEALSRLSLVRREEFEAVSELAANARDMQETLDSRIALLEARIAALESVPRPAATEQHGLDGAPGGPPPRHDDSGSDAPPPAI